MGIWIVAQKEKVVTARIVLLSEGLCKQKTERAAWKKQGAAGAAEHAG